MRILGIETSCDETGIAIYDDELRPQLLPPRKGYSRVNLNEARPDMKNYATLWVMLY